MSICGELYITIDSTNEPNSAFAAERATPAQGLGLFFQFFFSNVTEFDYVI
jgi:hypothetical protein